MATSNKPTRGVAIMLDGKERRLRYTLNTLEKIREQFGEEALSGGLRGDKLTKVLWLGFVHEDASLTEEQVGEFVDLENLEEVTNAMLKAMGKKGKVSLVDPQTPLSAPEAGEGASSK